MRSSDIGDWIFFFVLVLVLNLLILENLTSYQVFKGALSDHIQYLSSFPDY